MARRSSGTKPNEHARWRSEISISVTPRSFLPVISMSKNSKPEKEPWIDPDDAPEWTEEHFRSAAIYVGGKLVRPATGTWTRPGRPPKEDAKKQVTLRLDPDVLQAFRAMGKGWQSRINKALREALGI